MKKWDGCLIVAAFLISSMACTFGGSSQPQGTPDISVMTTSVAATLQAQNDQAPTRTPEEEVETHVCLPLHPGRQVLDLPSGFTAGKDNSLISFYDSEGNLLGEKQTPGLTRVHPSQIHIAGGITNGIPGAPLIYASPDSDGVIKGNIGSNIFGMDSPGEVVTVAGAEGIFTWIVYSAVENTDEGFITTLKTGEMGDLASISPQLTRVDDDRLVYYPLVVHGEEGQNHGTWFTLLKYKMSDFIFIPFHGLFYFDLTQNQVTEYLSTEYRFKGFSPDQSLVAFGNAPGANPEGEETSIIIKDLVNCQEWTFPYHDASMNGGGEVAISPDNQYAAWIESTGFTLEELNWRLRVASLDENQTFLVDSEINVLTGLAGGEIPSNIIPVGWLSNSVLLLEVNLPGSGQPNLLVAFAPDPSFPLDPALGANQSIPLAEGGFAGFLYP